MAYEGSGRLPMERASKIGHIKIIQDPRIQRLIEAFEREHDDAEDSLGELSGAIDLSQVGDLENVVAVDGSHCAVPNSLHEHKQLAFIKVSTVILRRSEIQAMKASPIVDPRDLAAHLERHSDSMMAALPLSNVVIPGETVAESIRKIVDSTLRENRLYDTLRFLVSREWLSAFEMQEHMDCLKCGKAFPLPRSALQFRCPHAYACRLSQRHDRRPGGLGERRGSDQFAQHHGDACAHVAA